MRGEGLAITQALVDGVHQEDLRPGMPVVVRANPNRSGPGKTVRLLDVTTQDDQIHPFYAANSSTRTLTPASSLAGNWAPSRQSMTAAWGAIARWPITPAGPRNPEAKQGRRALLRRTDAVPRDTRRTAHVEDPEYLEKPASFTMLWDHRPDLKLSPRSEVCDPKIARRYLEY